MEHWQVAQEVVPMRGELDALRHAKHSEDQRHAAVLTQQLGEQEQLLDMLRAEHRAEEQRHATAPADQLTEKQQRLTAVQQELTSAQAALVPFTDELVFQEAGVFRYHHVLENAEGYKNSLQELNARLKTMISTKAAVDANYDFTFNGSAAQGRKTVNDWCKVMLRAYNAEAENCLRVMKAGSVDAAKKRLDRTGEAIAKLGGMLGLRISREYRRLRMIELELTADHLRRKQEEKEAERAERERLRDEAKAQAGFKRELEKLEKERQHLATVRQALLDRGDLEAATAKQAELDEVLAGIEGVHQREANMRMGYVYVISNVGAFGPTMVKIGMTR